MYRDRCILMVFAAYVPMVDNLSIYRRVFIRKSRALAFVILIPVTRAVMNPKSHNNGHRIDEISFILWHSSHYLVVNDISHTMILLTYSHITPTIKQYYAYFMTYIYTYNTPM